MRIAFSPAGREGVPYIQLHPTAAQAKLPTVSQAGSNRLCGTLAQAKVDGNGRVGDTAVQVTSSAATKTAAQAEKSKFEVACPIDLTTTFPLERQPDRFDNLTCQALNRTYAAEEKYLDLTLTSNKEPKYYQQGGVARSTLFQRPQVSFLYERGWRSSFGWAGFPGEVKETEMAMDFLKPAYGDSLMDLSCGSGLFTRRLAKTKQFSSIYAVDYSAAMLRQAYDYIHADKDVDSSDILLVRADVGRLPFATGSIGAIHSAAAIHCWPDPRTGVAEVARVLKPGGVFVGSTFMTWESPIGQVIGDEWTRPLSTLDILQGSVYRWFRQDELQELFDSVGLFDFAVQRSNRFIMWSVRKPSGS